MRMVDDIRIYKTELRQQVKDQRRALPPAVKDKKDQAIRRRLQSLYQYRQADTLLCYVSTPIEVDTRRLIEDALARGKRVAVPRCIDGSRNMDFYVIHSFTDLERRTFGVLEPKVPGCEKLTDWSKSICVVPALLYDLKGYRLGYGAGYYDRFLSAYDGFKVGAVYGECVKRHLIHGRYDVPVDLLVTENYIRVTDRERVKKPVREKPKEKVLTQQTAAPYRRRRKKRPFSPMEGTAVPE